ncbi:MAG: acyloxyacyl hydrolase [Bacteroidota bacterium]
MSRHLAYIIFIAGLLFLSNKSLGQKDSFFNGLEFNYNPGYIMPHNTSIDYIIEENTSSFNIDLINQTTGEKLWQRVYNNPRLGYGFYHGSMGNNKVFGKSYSLYSFFDAPIFRIKDKFSLNYRLSYGISYITKPFDIKHNYNNIAIGSHLNIHFNLKLNSAIAINNRNKLIAGCAFTHFSNGKLNSPNKGLNIVSGNLGLRTMFNPPENKKNEKNEIPPVEDKNLVSAIWSHGFRDYALYSNRVDYVSTINVNYERKYRQWAKYGFGIDIFFNNMIRKSTNTNDIIRPIKEEAPSTYYRTGFHISHDFIVGDFSFLVQVGHYMQNKIFEDTLMFYNKVGLRYYLNNGLLFNLSLKAKLGNAEFTQFGIGYIW